MAANIPDVISRCLAGDDAAFDSLFAAHGRRVRAYFLRCGFGPADADDLTQDTFLRAFKSLGTFDATRGTFAGWSAATPRT